MSGILTAVYILFPAVLSVAELPTACSLRKSFCNPMLRHTPLIKHGLLTTVYIPAPAYVMSVLLTSAYIRKSVCRHFRGGSVLSLTHDTIP